MPYARARRLSRQAFEDVLATPWVAYKVGPPKGQTGRNIAKFFASRYESVEVVRLGVTQIWCGGPIDTFRISGVLGRLPVKEGAYTTATPKVGKGKQVGFLSHSAQSGRT